MHGSSGSISPPAGYVARHFGDVNGRPRCLELSADPPVDAVGVATRYGDLDESLDPVRRARIDVQFGRHAGLVESGRVGDRVVTKPVDVPDTDVCRRKSGKICCPRGRRVDGNLRRAVEVAEVGAPNRARVAPTAYHSRLSSR